MELVWITLAAIFSFMIVAAWVGSRLPKTHVAASRIRLKTPAKEIWRTITDFEAHPTWRFGLKRVERGQDSDGHETWLEVCSESSKVPFKVVEAVEGKRLVTQLVGENLPLVGRWTYELNEDGNGTVLTIIESDQIYNPLFRFFAKYVISYHGAIDVYLYELALKLGEPPRPEHLGIKRKLQHSS